MRHALVCALSLAALSAGCSPKSEGSAPGKAASNPIAALTKSGPPKPRPGIWESQMLMTAGPQPMNVSTQICLDEAMLKDDAWLNGGKDKAVGDCTQSYSAAGDGYVFQSVCKMGERTVTSKGVASGDFNNAYKVELVSTMTPLPPGMPPETKMTVSAKWLGPCAAGQAGGVIQGSTKITPVKAG